MSPYLKDKKHYEDRYDRMTVEDCLEAERYCLNKHKECPDKVEAKKIAVAMRHEWEMEKALLTLRWYNEKEDEIEKMMLADKRRDELVEAGTSHSNVTCVTCSKSMEESGRCLMYRDSKEEVLFFMRCPENMSPYKMVFQDGTELKSRRSTCPKCQSSVIKKTLSSNQYVVRTKYGCSNCDYQDIDSDTSLMSKEYVDADINFMINRYRFCLSGQLLLDTQEAALMIKDRITLFDDLESE